MQVGCARASVRLSSYRYAHYHSHRDTPEQLNYAAMVRVVMGLRAALTTVASRPGCSQ